MNSKHLSALIALFLAVGLVSCMNNLNDPSAGTVEQNIQQIKDHLTANQLQDQVTSTLSGLYYIITPSTSTAKVATPNEELEFTYTLSYIDPTTKKAILIDSANATKPAYIPFLAGVVVPGLEEGFLLMKEGQTGRFFMPNNLAFGSNTRENKMPEYSAVIFDVKLNRSRSQIQQMGDYATLKKLPRPDTIALAQGSDSVRVYRLSKGTGARITAGQTVTVAYTANTLRGTAPFDKSDSLTIKLGSGQYIVGFDKGISLLSVGDKALLVFPSGIGYGAQGSSDSKGYYVVPPYAPLAFEITVKSAK
ncbi:FKBP-type peptidyl-prolyl cis-trans isomerase [Larkinella sp.]|uniref:FKBP-type peptidyl-prolyl cis-trans isomerase n=1 Tax=Larkinella sp. TaxID=2034517 RepID=UPI003BAD3296